MIAKKLLAGICYDPVHFISIILHRRTFQHITHLGAPP